MVSKTVIRAYLDTNYFVDFPKGREVVRIGDKHLWLDRLLSKGSSTWAYLTAYAPASRKVDPKIDEPRQVALEAALVAFGYIILPGWGIASDGKWPPERSCLVLGISRAHAKALGQVFGQNAIVVGKKGERAELLMLVPNARNSS